ncbi:MAG: sensor histidine kinase, partial [Desulfobacterales bacterium]
MEEINKRCKRVEEINKRIAQKKADYERYNFSKVQNDIFKTFFDLAQEYNTLEDYYLISVAVLQEFIGVEARLYLLNEATHALEFVCDSTYGLPDAGAAAPDHIILCDNMYAVEGAFVVPIISKMMQATPQPPNDKELLLGMLEVEATHALTSQEQFFLDKFANRIGFNLYNRRITIQNIKHLKFINNLVMDIEHNVIIPNMYFKHLFNRIRS